MLSIPEVREHIASGLSDMGSSWAMAHCVDVNVNYTAASGVGCDLSMVGASEVFNYSEHVQTLLFLCFPGSGWWNICVTLFMPNSQGQAFITVNDIDSALAIFRVATGWL